jgi:hypothetical protein
MPPRTFPRFTSLPEYRTVPIISDSYWLTDGTDVYVTTHDLWEPASSIRGVHVGAATGSRPS